MTTGAAVLNRIVPAVVSLLEAVVEKAVGTGTTPTFYDLEALTQTVMPQIGQILLQEVTVAQGSGLVGPSRTCVCGGEQTYHDQRRGIVVQTSVGTIAVEQRAYYRCTRCRATSFPLDEQLGLGQAGRMSRYLQEQCAWLLAVLPGQAGAQTLQRFGWPPVSPSEVRAKGEALGAEMEERAQQRVAALQAAAAQSTDQPVAVRQPAQGSRLYAAPDGLRYCTTERDPQTGKLGWRELKAAAVYEVVPATRPALVRAPGRPDLRMRLQDFQATHAPDWALGPVDQAVRITYVARTESYARFGEFLWAELRERGLGAPVCDLAVVADGSPHLDAVVDSQLRLPDLQLTRILDLPHAQEHLWQVGKALFGEGTAACIRWVQAPLLALERGQVDSLCGSLTALAEAQADRAPDAAKTARTAAAYFADRAAQLDYPDFLAQGYQVGSGLAESACKRFGTDRMKGAGMRWTISGAQQVATLRMLLLSDRWQEVSDHCRKAA
jgi:hypothetical protein